MAIRRFWPLERGHTVTSSFGPRWGAFHYGTDFGWGGGSAGKAVYACQGGVVVMVGEASGFGQWVVVDHPSEDGGGTTVYGHVVPEVRKGQRVEGGQRIAHINPDRKTNGDVDPHLHLEWHRYVWVRPGSDRLDPVKQLAEATYPGEISAPREAATEKGKMHMESPITRKALSPSRHAGDRNVSWIAIHTQEGKGDIISYLRNPSNEVSYNAVVTDKESILVVPWDENPWSASNANNRADHILLGGSFAAWDRSKWLESDSSDGVDEDRMLTRAAALVAWRCQERGIPLQYVGGTGIIPPTKPGVCGHVDFGRWGGGHHDPGKNFPWDELMYRAKQFMEGLDMQLTDKIVNFEGKEVDLATLAFWVDKRGYQNEQMLIAILDQLLGPGAGKVIRDRAGSEFTGWEQNGHRSMNDTLAAVAAAVGVSGTKDTAISKQADQEA